MNVKESHIVTGMSRDSSVSKQNPNMVYDARNIRITVQGNNNTLMSVTNERGTQDITLNTTLYGTPIGCCVISDSLILFTHRDTQDDPDHIYRIIVTDNYAVTTLFKGNAGFSMKYPIEAQPMYETEVIQKVYWVDGKNQPRVINIVDTVEATNVDLFNFNREIELKHTLTVEKVNSGGVFPIGTIQYAMSYFNKFAQETNIFEITPMYYLSPKDRGLAADQQASCSFKIQLIRPDINFQYVRLYSIVRPSSNATPLCRIVGDYAIHVTSDDAITVVDNGEMGKTIDATALYYIGGEELVAGTLAQKDNTLFLGNISLNRSSIGNLPCNDGTINDIVNTNLAARRASIGNGAFFPDSSGALGTMSTKEIGYDGDSPNNIGPTGTGFYNYKPDNNRSSRYVKRFKAGESYRLGFIAQYKTGKWSEVIWIDDVKNLYRPRDLATPDGGVRYSTGAWEFTLDVNITTALKNAGYVRVAPVVVYPSLVDRLVYAQGLISPTVYNANDRLDGSPYAQASWFFRLFNGEPDVTIDKTKIPDIGEDWYYDKATWNRYGCYASAHNASLFPNQYARSEIQCNEGPRLYLPIAAKGGSSSIDSSTKLSGVDFLEYFNNYYFVDANILTLNSPDIDSSGELLQNDFNDLKVRIVGFSTVQSQATDTIITTDNVGINVGDSQILHYTMADRVPALAYYADSAVNNGDEDNVSVITADASYGWVTYPWHRQGSLNNQQPLTSRRKQNGFTTRTVMLKNKIEATLWYGTSKYITSDLFKALQSTSPQLFNNDQLSAIRLSRTDGSTVIYYGNIDKVLTATTPSKPSEGDINVDVPQYINHAWAKKNFVLDIADGYWTRRHWVKGKPSTFTFNSVGNTSDTTLSMNYKIGYPCYITGSITPALNLGFINPEQVDTPFEGRLSSDSPRSVSKDPIPMKYKSAPHLVFSLKETTGVQQALPTFRDSLGTTMASYGDYLSNQYTTLRFWDDNQPSIQKAFDITDFGITNTQQGLFIGEVYRKESKDFILNRFGGLSQEALVTNNWVRCGDSVSLSDSPVKLTFLEGDTYFQRYDCLKTYPFTMEDLNSIIEMYSTTVETRVNLDFAYNRNRGMRNNTTVLPNNFNLFNHPAYEQDNNFFTYHSLDYNRYKNNKFPSTITWSLEKQLGEDIDSWASIDVNNIYDMDGALGEVRKLFKFNDNLYCLQDIGFSQLLFNSRVQIPASDGVPIEITNGMKMQGIRYLSDKVGCINKWSFVSSPVGVYWIDDTSRITYLFNGQLKNLSSEKGMQTWMNEACTMKPWDLATKDNCWGFYNNITKDVIWVYNDIALSYSEVLGQYVSFVDYGSMLAATHINGHILGFTNDTVDNSSVALPWELGTGSYNMFFGQYKPYWLTFISNSYPTENKIFNNLAWRDIVKDNTTDKPFVTFDHIEVWNEHQNTGKVRFINSLKELAGKQPVSYNAAQSNLRKKFNVWRCQIPRDTLATNSGRARISNPWTYIKLSREDINTYRHEFTDLEVDFFM